jgi:peptidoglycan/LPS O-acetylase OafA/YrhL
VRPQPETRASAGIGYAPQIDTLRCIAVGFVFLEHFLPYQAHRLGIHGGYGVWMFFAISGFLITNILLDYKRAIESSQATLLHALGVFYARRSLRIFPVYYLLLFVLLASGFVAWRGEFFWHLTYTTNFWTVKNNEWGFYAGHFWSLAVEEQFYLVWPFVLLSAPRKALIWIIGIGVGCALAFRAWAILSGHGLMAFAMPISNFDTLGAGALLAWLHHRGSENILEPLRRHGGWALLLLPVMIFWPGQLKNILEPLLTALIALYLIERCVAGFRRTLGRLFALPPIVYLGRISYGLYLYHYVIRWYLPQSWLESYSLPFQPYVTALVWSAATIAVAALSWHFFEAPINAFKKNFRIV